VCDRRRGGGGGGGVVWFVHIRGERGNSSLRCRGEED